MANCGQDVRRLPSSSAKVGKSFGSLRLPAVWWKEGDSIGNGEWIDVRAAFDGDGDMAPLPPDADGTVIDRVDDSLREAVRPPPALLGEGGCDCDDTAFSDFDRSWSRWADEWCTVLGDLQPASRLAVGTGIFVAIVKGGGRIGSTPEEDAFSSFSLVNRRGDRFKLDTLLVTYCCRALKKLIFLEIIQICLFAFRFSFYSKRVSRHRASLPDLMEAEVPLEGSSALQ